MAIITDYPDHLMAIDTLYLGEDHKAFTVEAIQRHHLDALVKFEGISDRDQADSYRGEIVTIHKKDAVPLEEGEYYLFQLQGIMVVTDMGDVLGVFSGYLETGANDVYIVTAPDGREILLPAIADVVKEVNLKEKKMIVHLLDGLLDGQ